METSDLDQVTGLYRRAMGSDADDESLREWFERMLFSSPFVDPDIPSLVVESGGEVVAALGSHPRPFRVGDREGVVACSGPMVTAPDARKFAPGAFLARRYLDGPQDLTITDGATEEVRALWERLHGQPAYVRCMEWHRPIRPGSMVASLVSGRRHSREPGPIISGMGRAADRVARALPDPPFMRSARSASDFGDRAKGTHPLTGKGLIELLGEIGPRSRLHARYDDPAQADWLLQQVRLAPRGDVRARLVRNRDGRALGAFVYYLQERAVSPVVAVLAPDEAIAGVILGAMFEDAEAGGAASLRGRVEPQIMAPLAQFGCPIRYIGQSLIHASDPATMALTNAPDAIMTRLDGEWWMMPRRLEDPPRSPVPG